MKSSHSNPRMTVYQGGLQTPTHLYSFIPASSLKTSRSPSCQNDYGDIRTCVSLSEIEGSNYSAISFNACYIYVLKWLISVRNHKLIQRIITYVCLVSQLFQIVNMNSNELFYFFIFLLDFLFGIGILLILNLDSLFVICNIR